MTSEAPSAPAVSADRAAPVPEAARSSSPASPFGPSPAGPAQLADFGTRLGAYLIDAGIVALPYVIAYNVALQLSVGLGLFVLVGGVGLIAWYFATYEGGATGQTIGKRQLGIAVVDATTLQPGIGAGRAVVRYLGRLLDVIVCGLPIGYLAMLWDDAGQTWHDKVATTKVVKVAP